MKEQYREETSQIHAPSDLVQKTRDAMRQEEQRLKKERRRYRVSRWTLPLSAAAAVVVLLTVTMVMRGAIGSRISSDKAQDDAYSGEMSMQFGEADLAADYAEDAEGTDDKTPAALVRPDAFIIEITEVKEEPDFYYSLDTEACYYEDLLFWVNQNESGEWSAYVSVRGDRYVIVSDIEEQERFLEEAYALLLETRGTLR